MVKNTGGGSKHKKMASKTANFKPKTLYAVKEQGMMYGKVLKKLGGTHMQVLCTNGKIMTAKISGTMRKRKWINVGDIILVSPRDFETNQDNCDILYCYDYDEAKTLSSMGEIAFEINQKTDDIKFDDIDIDVNDSDEDPLNDSNGDGDEDDLPANLNRSTPLKTGKSIKSRNNKRDEKLSRIESLTHGDDE
jgi:translation initiation factor 1A